MKSNAMMGSAGGSLWLLFSGNLAAGLAAGLLPALHCYRRSLSAGLTPDVGNWPVTGISTMKDGTIDFRGG